MVNLVNAERVSCTYGTRTAAGRGEPRVSARRRDRRRRAQRRRQDHPAARADRHRRARLRPGHPHRSGCRSATCTRPTTSRRTRRSATSSSAGEADHVWAADAWTRAVRRAPARRGRPGQRRSRPLSGGERRRVALAALLLATTTCWCSTSRPTTSTSRPSPGWPSTCARCRPRRRCSWSATTAGSSTRSAPGSGRCTTARSTRTTAATRRTCWPGPSATGRPRDRGQAAEPAAQGAGLAAARAARPHLQAAVPDRRRQRADRRRAAAARPARAAAVRHRPARQGRLRPERRRPSPVGDRGAARRPDLAIGPGDRIGLVGVNGAGKTTLLRLLDRRTWRPTPGGSSAAGPSASATCRRTSPSSTPTPSGCWSRSSRSQRRSTPVASGAEVTASQLLRGLRLHRRTS